MGKTKKFAVSAAVAAAAGYVAGILTAPKSGKETRGDIQASASKAKREAEKRLKDLHSQLNDVVDQAKKSSSKLTGKAEVDWAKLVQAAVTSKDKVRTVLSSIHEGESDDKELQQVISDASKAVDDLKKYLKKNLKV